MKIKRKRKNLIDSAELYLNKKLIGGADKSSNFDEKESDKVFKTYEKKYNNSPLLIDTGEHNIGSYYSGTGRNSSRSGIKITKFKPGEDKSKVLKASGLLDNDFTTDEIKKKLNNIEHIVSTNDPAVLAHELGHSRQKQSSIGRLLYNGSKKHNKFWRRSAAVSGFVSGYQAGENGENDTIGNKALAYAPSAIQGLSTLPHEAGASIRGLKLMKEAGVSKKSMKMGRKRLGFALGTYAVSPTVNAGISYVSRKAGKAVGKLSKKKNEDKKK